MIVKITALLEGLSGEDLDKATPLQRQQFSELCRHWHLQAERRLGDQIVSDAKTALEEPKSGVLLDLKRGQRSE
jgi:hypothetical protein